MTNKEQAYAALRDYLRAEEYAPWTAVTAEKYGSHDWMAPRLALQRLGGMAGSWDLSVINDWDNGADTAICRL